MSRALFRDMCVRGITLKKKSPLYVLKECWLLSSAMVCSWFSVSPQSVCFFVQADRYNIHSQLEHCKLSCMQNALAISCVRIPLQYSPNMWERVMQTSQNCELWVRWHLFVLCGTFVCIVQVGTRSSSKCSKNRTFIMAIWRYISIFRNSNAPFCASFISF